MSDIDANDSSRSLLSKADEFLKRRRAQLGNPMMEASAPVDAEEDIPVLTEVVSPHGSAEPAALPLAEREFNADVAREMDAWLDENLPQVVMHALDGITDRLIAQIHESARTDLLPRLRATLGETPEMDNGSNGPGKMQE